MSLTYGEMFAGYGGLGLGIQSALGGEMSWCAEFDAAPSKILAHHWPTVPNLGDVTKVDWANVPKVDVITGGSPCQDLSHAGKRAGMKAGTRSGLWSSMCDAIEVIHPSLVVWENVRGALSAEADSEMEQCAGCVGGGDDGPVLRALGRVLGDLADIGYDANWYGLRAADVGAAHGRFRVFVFATPADADSSGLSEHGRGVTVRPEQPAAERDGDPALTLLPTPAVNDMGAGKTVDAWDAWDAWTDAMQAKHGNGNGHGKSLDIEAQRLFSTPQARDHKGRPADGYNTACLVRDVEDLAGEHLLPTPRATRGGSATETVVLLPTPRATDGTKGGPNQRGSSGDLMLPSAVQDWREYATAIRRQEQAFGRPAPQPTEPGKNGQPRLSPAFVEWLMGLPAGHVTDVPGISRNDQLKALGNGVVPQQAAVATQVFLTDLAREAAA
jgi:DNA (cytosine-5)-methyltransferase 1